MAWLEQPDGSRLALFGEGGGQAVADRLAALQESPVSVLGQIPISIPLREGSDQGTPVVVEHPEDPAAVALTKIANLLATEKVGLAGKRLKINL